MTSKPTNGQSSGSNSVDDAKWSVPRRMVPALFACALVATGAIGPPAVAQVSDTEAVVIPFDFVSTFDDGKMGRKLAEMFWQKLSRRGRFIVPETVQDVRDFCRSNGIAVTVDTPLEKVRVIVQRDFAAHIAIWGQIERAPGARYDIYDLEIFIVDFRHDPPRVVYHKKARTRSVSEIPHVYVREALDALYGTSTPRPDRPRPVPQYSSKQLGPNLVRGDFESGRKHPSGWDPLPAHVSWTWEEGSRRNRIIRFDIPKPVAATMGVLYYSAYFRVEPGKKYLLRVRWRSTGTAAKVFVKCYDTLKTRFRERRRPDPVGVNASDEELREVYRLQANLKGEPNRWHVHVEEFTPKHSKFRPRWARVMLYAYWPPGTVEWDDVEIREVLAEPGASLR